MTPIARPRDPAELAVLLPYQLGYHPGPSVVVVLLHDRRLGMLQRHDLVDDPGACREVARQAIDIATREEATSVVVIAHERDEGGSAPLCAAMLDAARAADLPVRERLVVRDGRWFSPDCRDGCCPEEGRPLPRPEDVPAVAPFVHAGVAPLADRAALVDDVLPPRDEARARAVGRHLAPPGNRGDWTERAEEVLDWWMLLLDPSPQAPPVTDLPDVGLAWVATSLQDVLWRDALMGILCPGTMPVAPQAEAAVEVAAAVAAGCPWTDPPSVPGEHVAGDWHEEVLVVRSRLVEVARLLPERATPPVLTLVAHIAWWSGDGTVAGVCLERALEVDPGYRLADLMLRLLSAGVRPWDEPGATVPGSAA